MPQRILVIDDEEDIRALVVLLLEGAGYVAREARDGAQGLKLLAEQGADAVILDVMMPGMSGWEVCRHIRANPAIADTPVLILTVRSLLTEREKTEVAHADAFVNKPFEMKTLLDAVSRVLAVRTAPGHGLP